MNIYEDIANLNEKYSEIYSSLTQSESKSDFLAQTKDSKLEDLMDVNH